MIVPQHAAKPFTTFNLTITLANFVTRPDDLVAPTLVISLGMIMIDVRTDSPSHGLLAEQNDSIETFGF